jgi:hypothetical protein
VTRRISNLLFGYRGGRLTAEWLAAGENPEAWLMPAMSNIA